MQQSKAHAKMQRITARKVRLVLDKIRGLSVAEAEAVLSNLDRRASTIVLKVLKSAEANAQNNHNMDVEKLFVKATYATEGPTLKRIRARAKGAASPINKRTSHITVILEEK